MNNVIKHVIIPLFQQLPRISEGEIHFFYVPCNTDRESDSDYEGTSSNPQRFNQTKLSDLIRDLCFSKEASELLASRLNEIKTYLIVVQKNILS